MRESQGSERTAEGTGGNRMPPAGKIAVSVAALLAMGVAGLFSYPKFKRIEVFEFRPQPGVSRGGRKSPPGEIFCFVSLTV